MTAPITAPVEVKFRASGVNEVQRGLRLVGKEGDASARQVGSSTRQLAMGLETIARTGKIAGEGIRQVIAQGAEMAFMFGAGGPIVGAIGIVGIAIYEHITGKMKEARDEINKTRTEFEGMGDFASSGKAMQSRYSGNPNAIRKEGESNADFIARRYGIEGVRGRIEQLRGQIPKNILDQIGGGKTSFGLQTKAVGDAANEMVGLLDQLIRLKRESAEIAPIVEKMADAEGKRAKTAQQMSREQIEKDFLLSGSTSGGRDQLLALDRAKRLGGIPGIQITPGQTQGPGAIGGAEGFRSFGIKAANIGENFKETFVNPLADSITKSIGEGIGGAISAGFDAAFAKGGNIGGVAAAFGGVALRTMGGVFKDIGMQSLLGLEFMATIKAAIATWNPALGIAASIGLIALGSAMQSAAGRMGANAAGGGGGGGGSSVAPTTIIDRGTINPVMNAASNITPRTTVTLQPIIIGPNDASAQRGILELVRNAERRGSV